jgi:hypothetical protein
MGQVRLNESSQVSIPHGRAGGSPLLEMAGWLMELRYGRYRFCPELGFGYTGLANSIRHTGPSGNSWPSDFRKPGAFPPAIQT